MKTNFASKSLKSTDSFKASVLTASMLAVLSVTNVTPAAAACCNTAVGTSALIVNTTGEWNSAFGYEVLYSNHTGNSNTANGFQTLYSNTTGNSNTASGLQALLLNNTGNNNSASGRSALQNNSTGSNNTATGYNALRRNNTGYSNTANGWSALYKNTAGKFNTAVGYAADVAFGNLSNATAIGYNAKVNTSNKVRIGNPFVNVIEGQVPWSSTSDKRLKNHIGDLTLGLDFITKLRPVEYIRNNNAAKTKEWGVIAQELQQTLKDAGYKDAGIVTEDNTAEKYMTVRYNDLLAPMIKAIQEQQKTIVALQKRIEVLEKK